MALLSACASDAPAPPPAAAAPVLRILLKEASATPGAPVETPGPYTLCDPATGDVLETGSRLDRPVPASVPRPMRLLPASGTLSVAGRTYRGSLLIRPAEPGVELILETDIEEYLPGVLAGELGPTYPPAALRAQAVVSRTFAVHRRQARLATGSWDLTDDTSDQVFLGVSDHPALRDAVADTRGMVLLWRGQVLPAHFSSTCGGHTAARDEVFGGPAIPPLAGTPCPFCASGKYSRWTVRIPAADAGRSLGLPGPLESVEPLARDRAGRSLTVRIRGGATRDMAASQLRSSLGVSVLRSTFLLNVRRVGSDIVFDGAGWGHGVGLCQIGATGMARKGAGSSDILKHYYPGAQLCRLYR